MKETLMLKRLLLLISMLLFNLHALAGQIGEVVPTAKDDTTAVAQLKSQPAKHALLYFGDHAN
jgi:hypothetical protein